MTCRLTPVLLMVALLANQPRPPVAPPASAQQATIEQRPPQPTPRLPLAFQAHTGSPDPEVRFAARGGGFAVFVMSQGFALALPATTQPVGAARPAFDVVRWKFIGATPGAALSGEEKLAFRIHDLRGKNASRVGRTGDASYARVQVRQLYDGVGVTYHGVGQSLQHDFTIAPGADPSAIRFTVAGAPPVRVTDDGDLILGSKRGELRQTRPVAHQEIDGRKRDVTVRYSLEGDIVSFALGGYDRAHPLVIDPTLDFARFVGTAYTDLASDVTVDGRGAAYLAGKTNWPDGFPLSGAIVSSETIAVWKVDAAGTPVYLALIGEGWARSVQVNEAGKVYVAGGTWGTGIPVTADASGRVRRAGADAFAACLDESGAAIVYSTYIAGTAFDMAEGVDIDPLGNAYVIGTTYSVDFPGSAARGLSGPSDVFFVKVDSQGRFSYPMLVGGTSRDEGAAIAVDDQGSVYLTGGTTNDFPTTPGAYREGFRYPTPLHGFIFVMKLRQDPIITHVPLTLPVAYATLIGNGEVHGLAVHDRSAYITGATGDFAFPTTEGAFSRVFHIGAGGVCFGEACREAFVTRLRSDGAALAYSTLLGGINDDAGQSVAVDRRGLAYVTGQTGSPGAMLGTPTFPATPDALQPTPGTTGYDAFLVVFSEDDRRLQYGTFIGSNGEDIGTGVALLAPASANPVAYVGGYSLRASTGGVIFRPPAWYAGGESDTFIVRIGF